MSSKQEKEPGKAAAGNKKGSAAVKTRKKKTPKKSPPKLLPQWKVLLHNDDVNSMPFVVLSIVELTPLKEQDALLKMEEAHRTGVALLLVTHKERAELYQDQFKSKGLTVTIEPAE
jgi:ATP-dependent Clp protease adaptor protein ClpS